MSIAIPGHELAIARDPAENVQHTDLHAAIEDVFDDAERALQHHAELLRRDVKTRSGSTRGRISKIFHALGYGFITPNDAPSDATEVYFHENSVLHGRFAKLAVGDEVRFAEEDGDKGPQASTVIAPSKRARAIVARV